MKVSPMWAFIPRGYVATHVYKDAKDQKDAGDRKDTEEIKGERIDHSKVYQ
tara:strand:+ start:242 stop:394 length:153 start_codon:yes stop_codon:yes gene_type:complete